MDSVPPDSHDDLPPYGDDEQGEDKNSNWLGDKDESTGENFGSYTGHSSGNRSIKTEGKANRDLPDDASLANFNLPDNWEDDNIPTLSEMGQESRKQINRLLGKIAKGPRPANEKDLAELYEALSIGTDFPELLTVVIEIGLSLEDVIRGAGFNELWYALLMRLNFSAMRISDETLRSDFLTRILNPLGRIAGYRNKLTHAQMILKHAQEYALNNELKSDWLLARVELLAATYVGKDLKSIEEDLDDLILLVKKYQDNYTQMYLYDVLAQVYNYYGDNAQSFAYAQQAFILAHTQDKNIRKFSALMSMTSIASREPMLEQYAESLFTYIAQKETALKTDLRFALTFFAHSAANLYCTRRFERARIQYELAIKMARRFDSPTKLAMQLYGYGQTLTQLGKYDEAEAAYQEALSIYQNKDNEISHSVSILHCLHCLGWNSLKRSDYPEAVKRLEEALNYGESLPQTAAIQRELEHLRPDLDKARNGLID